MLLRGGQSIFSVGASSPANSSELRTPRTFSLTREGFLSTSLDVGTLEIDGSGSHAAHKSPKTTKQHIPMLEGVRTVKTSRSYCISYLPCGSLKIATACHFCRGAPKPSCSLQTLPPLKGRCHQHVRLSPSSHANPIPVLHETPPRTNQPPHEPPLHRRRPYRHPPGSCRVHKKVAVRCSHALNPHLVATFASLGLSGRSGFKNSGRNAELSGTTVALVYIIYNELY